MHVINNVQPLGGNQMSKEIVEKVVDVIKKRPKRKRRIKRSANVKRYYFDAETQRNIELFQSSANPVEREQLYVKNIFPAFDMLVQKKRDTFLSKAYRP